MIDGLANNKFLWFHLISGAVAAKIINIWLHPQLTVIIVLVCAILWEVFEYVKDDVEKIYGSKKRFYKDALQDIAGAVIMSIVVVI